MINIPACLTIGAAVAGFCLAGVAHAIAKPVVKTQYSFYAVSGSTPESLYVDMVASGPHVAGRKAFGATTAYSTQSGVWSAGKQCRIRDFQINLEFVISLPKVSSEKGMSKSTRARWRKFAAFVKKHEERHRSIWIDCARQAERQINAVRAPTCRQAAMKAERINAAVQKSCDLKHAAFDKAESKRLATHPLVRAAISSARKSRAASISNVTTRQKNWRTPPTDR